MQSNEIGRINVEREGMFLQINKEYIKGLHGLEKSSHVDVPWWFYRCDNNESNGKISLTTDTSEIY